MKHEFLLLLHVLLMLYTKCIMSTKVATFSLFSDVSGFVCPNEYIIFERKMSEIACMLLCGNDDSCEGVDYNAATKVCHGCKGLAGGTCAYEPTTYKNVTGTRMHAKDSRSFLVSGTLAIPDDHFTESSAYYPSLSGENSRYCLFPVGGGWIPRTADSNQWVQARFWRLAIVKGVYLLPRMAFDDYVASFKLMYSADCSQFQYYNTSSGEDMVFQGTQADLAPVTALLPSSVSALCIQIIPTVWGRHIACYFDVIGRYP